MKPKHWFFAAGVIVYLVLMKLTSLGPFSLFFELVGVVAVITALATVPVLLLRLTSRRLTSRRLPGKTAENALIVVLILVLVLLIGHLGMSIRLRGLKQEFLQVVDETGRPALIYGAGLRENRAGLDYGGKLDRIVRSRNQILNRYHFVGLGTWEASESPWPHLFMVYLFMGPFHNHQDEQKSQ